MTRRHGSLQRLHIVCSPLACMSYSSWLLLMKQVNDESISPGTWSNQGLILHAHMCLFSGWSVSPSDVSSGTSFLELEDQGNLPWYGRRFLAENTLGFMKDGGDERLPRFLSRAVALSKGCTGHGFRLHGQRRVSSYYYWDRLVIFMVGYFFFLLLLVS